MTAFAARLYPQADGADDPATRAAVRARLERLGPDGFAEVRRGRCELRQAVLAPLPGALTEPEPRTLDGRHWIVGEIRIDARTDLLALLRQHGASVSEQASDHALVLHAYAVWGEECATRLQGEYAFAIWDEAAQTLFAVRDRMGARLLAYTRLPDGGWLVANAIGPLLAHPEVDRALDPAAVGDFLTVSYSLVPARSIFARIDRLAPAHRLTIAGETPRTQRYWQAPSPHIDAPELSPAARIERFAAVLAEAVRDRLRIDRAAVSLSGGVDSPLVTALARRATATRLEAFSVGFDWLIPDTERHFAAQAAQHLAVPFHSISGDEVLLDGDEPWALPPEPRFSLRRAPGHLMADRIVGQGHRVVLNGMGGDVLGAGVPDYWARLIRERRLREFAASWRAFRGFFGERPPIRLSLQRHALLRRLPAPTVPSWLAADFAADHGIVERFMRYRGGAVLRDQRTTLTEDPFWAETLMGLSPEGAGGRPLRHAAPLLDARVVEASLALPPIPFLHRKTILREVARPLLPSIIVDRRKSPLGGEPGRAAALSGVDPCRAALSRAGPIDAFVDRAALLARLDRPEQLHPGEYTTSIERAAGFAQWLTAWSAHRL